MRNLEFGSSKAQTLSPDGKYLVGKPQWGQRDCDLQRHPEQGADADQVERHFIEAGGLAGKSRLVYEDNKELQVFSVPAFTPKTIIKVGGLETHGRRVGDQRWRSVLRRSHPQREHPRNRGL